VPELAVPSACRIKFNRAIAISLLAITVAAVMLTRCNGFFEQKFSRSPAELYGVKQENQTEVLAPKMFLAQWRRQ
jgi:hypothetical protein